MIDDNTPQVDVINVNARMADWRLAQRLIKQQQQHGWTLEAIDKVEAVNAIEDAYQLAADLRHLAEIIELSAKRAAGMLEDDA